MKSLKVIFDQGVAEGSFREMDTAGAAEIFLGAVIITLEHRAALPETRSIDESVALLLDVLFKGFEPRSS